MTKPKLRLVAPATVKRTVLPPGRRPNADLRAREHLTEAEIERLMEAAKGNRHGRRDATMVLVAYRHGLRVGELVDLRWDQVDFKTATLHVRRATAEQSTSVRSPQPPRLTRLTSVPKQLESNIRLTVNGTCVVPDLLARPEDRLK